MPEDYYTNENSDKLCCQQTEWSTYSHWILSWRPIVLFSELLCELCYFQLILNTHNYLNFYLSFSLKFFFKSRTPISWSLYLSLFGTKFLAVKARAIMNEIPGVVRNSPKVFSTKFTNDAMQVRSIHFLFSFWKKLVRYEFSVLWPCSFSNFETFFRL